MESFFGSLKTEIFYGFESQYKTIDDLIKAIEDYIYYYNNDRIKSRLKGLTPMEYRNQALMSSQNLTCPNNWGQFSTTVIPT